MINKPQRVYTRMGLLSLRGDFMKRKKYLLISLLVLIILLLSLNWMWIFKLYRVSLNLLCEYKNIKIKDYGITYYLPQSFNLNTIDLNDKVVLYHADFISSDKNIRGIVEVLNIGDLKTYLEKSKKSATGAVDFKYFNIYNKKVANKNAFVVEYLRRGNDNRYYRAYEYFIPTSQGYVFRMSFFIPDDIFNNNFYNLFEDIVNKTLIS